MPNTPNHQLSYPDDEDWLNQGAYAIEQLAARLDAIVAGNDMATIQDAESAGIVGGVVDFPGAQLLSSFTYAAGSLTFTGPAARLFLIAADVEVVHNTPPGDPSLAAVSSTLSVRVDGATVAGSHDHVSHDPASIRARTVVHNVTAPALLQPGQVITVVAGGNPTGQHLGIVGLRVYPIGPRS